MAAAPVAPRHASSSDARVNHSATPHAQGALSTVPALRWPTPNHYPYQRILYVGSGGLVFGIDQEPIPTGTLATPVVFVGV